MSLKQLRRMFETAEKGLSRRMHPILKNNRFPNINELELFIELGYSSREMNKMFNVKEDVK